MPRGKKHGPEEIILKLREAEVLISQGMAQELAAKQIGVSAQTLIRQLKEVASLSAAKGSGELREVSPSRRHLRS